MSAHLHIKMPGLFTTLQDLGRFGFQSLGIPVSGALDTVSLRLANALVGNPQDTPGIEIRFQGPVIKVCADAVRVALVGTSGVIEILEPEPKQIPAGQSALIMRDQVFRVGAVADTGVCYLAVHGGFGLPAVLSSYATYEPALLGGLNGRRLQAGDVLPLNASEPEPSRNLHLSSPFPHDTLGPIRVVPGPQADHFTESAWEIMRSQAYRVTAEANRMGLRLDGPALDHLAGFNIASDGIVNGSIQVPGSGQPIILLADRQTTGGYPKIATVISADLPRLGRMQPGQSLSFEVVDVSTAEDLRREYEKQIESFLQRIKPLPETAADLEYALRRENLVSGVTFAQKE